MKSTAHVAVFVEAVLVHVEHCHLHGRLVGHRSRRFHCDWEDPQPWDLGRSADAAQEQTKTESHGEQLNGETKSYGAAERGRA